MHTSNEIIYTKHTTPESMPDTENRSLMCLINSFKHGLTKDLKKTIVSEKENKKGVYLLPTKGVTSPDIVVHTVRYQYLGTITPNITFKIPTNGNDLLSSVSLSCALPGLPPHHRWDPQFASRLIERVTMTVNGHECTGDLSGDVNTMLCHVYGKTLFDVEAYQHMSLAEQCKQSQSPMHIEIPLMLPMSRFRCRAFPLFQLQCSVKINIRLNSLRDLVVVTTSDVESSRLPSLSDVYLIAEHVEVASEYAHWMNLHSEPSMNFHIQHQLQFDGEHEIPLCSKGDCIRTLTLDFKLMCSGFLLQFYLFDYDAWSTITSDITPFKDCTLFIHDVPVFYDTAKRMSTVQWQRCGVNRPPKQKSDQWYLLPLSPNMFDDLPTGAVNMSHFNREVILQFRMNSGITVKNRVAWVVRVTALSLNIAQTHHGMYSVRYAN